MSKALETLRTQIDQLNLQLLNLLSQRGELVCEVGRLKQKEGHTNWHDPEREQAQMQFLQQHNAGPYDDNQISHIFQAIFEASLSLEIQNQGSTPKDETA